MLPLEVGSYVPLKIRGIYFETPGIQLKLPSFDQLVAFVGRKYGMPISILIESGRTIHHWLRPHPLKTEIIGNSNLYRKQITLPHPTWAFYFLCF